LVVDQVILRVLAAEVQRRRCPGCNKPLRQADISAHFSGVDKVQLHFRCRFCVFEGGGEIELTPEIYEEAARNGPAEAGADLASEPISAAGRAASPTCSLPKPRRRPSNRVRPGLRRPML
jgi:hypothetical protein